MTFFEAAEKTGGRKGAVIIAEALIEQLGLVCPVGTGYDFGELSLPETILGGNITNSKVLRLLQSLSI